MAGILNQYLEDYQKAAQRANREAEGYNNTLVMGSDGKPVGYKDGYYSQNFNGSWDEAMMTPSPKDPTVKMLRQNPTETIDNRTFFTQNQETGLYSREGDTEWYRLNASPDTGAPYMSNDGGSFFVNSGDGGYYTGGFSYQFPDQPEAFTKKKPTFTLAQEQQLGQPTEDVAMADMERGNNGIISRLLERKHEQD